MSHHIQTLRACYADLAAQAALRWSLNMGSVKERAARLLPEAPERADAETAEAERWISAVSSFLDGGYPRGEAVEATPGWDGAASRRIHAELSQVNREQRIGLSSRDLHRDFWGFCFAICGRVPQELDRQACETCLDLWASTRGARRVA